MNTPCSSRGPGSTFAALPTTAPYTRPSPFYDDGDSESISDVSSYSDGDGIDSRLIFDMEMDDDTDSEMEDDSHFVEKGMFK